MEDLLHERGLDICHETVRFWNRFGPLFASEIHQKRVQAMRQHLRFIMLASKALAGRGELEPTDKMLFLEAAQALITVLRGRKDWKRHRNTIHFTLLTPFFGLNIDALAELIADLRRMSCKDEFDAFERLTDLLMAGLTISRTRSSLA